jgi:hypothetical protein
LASSPSCCAFWVLAKKPLSLPNKIILATNRSLAK